MKSTPAKPPQYLQKKGKTRSITYRLPEKIVDYWVYHFDYRINVFSI